MGALKSPKCSRGHRFTEANTIQYSNGKRECRACKAIRYQQRKQREHEARKTAA